MESLKQFRVNFQVTFWCEGRKGIFSKKPYKFTVSFCDDTGYEIKFISCEMVCDWAKERVERAARELTMEQFKQVFSEIPAEIFH